MAANLSIARAKVTLPDGELLDKVSLLVRQNTATIRLGSDVVTTADVTAVQRASGRNRWTITLASGETWAVERVGGCGCGG